MAEQGGAVVPIRLGELEVVVVEQVVCHCLLLVVYLPQQMVCSHVDTFLVVPVPWCRRRYQ